MAMQCRHCLAWTRDEESRGKVRFMRATISASSTKAAADYYVRYGLLAPLGANDLLS